MLSIFLLSAVTACISFTISEMHIFAGWRRAVANRNKLLGELVSCAYCMGHWIAFFLVAIYRPKLFESWWLLDYFLTGLLIAWLSALQWIIMCWLMDRAGK